MEQNRIVSGLKMAMTLAVKYNNWSAVRRHIENMVHKDSVEYSQLLHIPIHNNIIKEACTRGFTELVSIFLNNGFSVDCEVDERNETMLQLAVSEGHLSLVKLLLNSGANPNRKTYDDGLPLYSAIQSGHLDVVKDLLLAGADINKPCKYDDTALHLAASQRNIPVIKVMLENGADVNVTNNEGDSILHTAIWNGNIPLIKLLKENGADVNIRNNDGDTILHVAARFLNLAVISLLVEYEADINHRALLSGDLPSVHINHRALVSRGLPSVQSVEFPIEHGCLINSINNRLETPLAICIKNKKFDVAMFLLNSGADLDLCIHHNVLHIAMLAYAPVELIEFLLEKGASVTAVFLGSTALRDIFFSHRYRFLNVYRIDWKLSIMKLLLIYGSDHYVEDYQGNTVLHRACEIGDVELVQYLIDYGLNVDAKNSKGKKPYDIARERGYTNIVKAIILYHCNKYTNFNF